MPHRHTPLTEIQINAIHEAGHALSAWVHGESIDFAELFVGAAAGEWGGRVRIAEPTCLVTWLCGMAAQSRALAEDQDEPLTWIFQLWDATLRLFTWRYATCAEHDIHQLSQVDADGRERQLRGAHHLISQIDAWLAVHALSHRLVLEGRINASDISSAMASHMSALRRLQLRAEVAEAVGRPTLPPLI